MNNEILSYWGEIVSEALEDENIVLTYEQIEIVAEKIKKGFGDYEKNTKERRE